MSQMQAQLRSGFLPSGPSTPCRVLAMNLPLAPYQRTGRSIPGMPKLAPRQQRGANGSDLGILSEGKSILHINSEVSDRILDLAMAEEDLDGTQVTGRPIDD